MGIEIWLGASLVAVLLVSIVAGFVILLRWRVAFEGKELVVVPGKTLTNYDQTLAGLKDEVCALQERTVHRLVESEKAASQIWQANQALLRAFKELRQEFSEIRSEVYAKSREIENLKEGADRQRDAHALIPVCRSHALLRAELQQSPPTIRETLRYLLDDVTGALETAGVVIYEPKVDELVRTERHIKLPPEIVETTDTERVGRIETVKRAAYLLPHGNGVIQILPAVVGVFAHQKLTEEVEND